MFTLSCDPPSRPKLPRSRAALLRALTDRREWAPRDAARVWRLSERWGIYEDNRQEAPIIEEAERQAREWERIKSAPPLPSTARLRRLALVPPREERARAIHARIIDAQRKRESELRPLLRPRKTWKARQREEDRVFGADAKLARLDKAMAALRRRACGVDYRSVSW